MNFCTMCGSHIFGSRFEPPHECPPKWRCRCQSRHSPDADGYLVYAKDAQHAAERAAERYHLDRGKFYRLSERHSEYAGILIEVTDESGVVTLYRTFIASSPVFIAENSGLAGSQATDEFEKTWPKSE